MNFIFDNEKCVACAACTIACADYNDLGPISDIRQIVRRESGTFPNVKADTITMSCLHCENAECVEQCPTGALYYEEEFNTVQIDYEKCINCHVCVAACPYDQIKVNEEGKVVKCDFCIDELRKGNNPICVDACHTRCLNYSMDIAPDSTSINKYLNKDNNLKPRFYLRGDV